VRNLQHVLGIELMCAAQAIDFRLPLRPGRGVATAHGLVRELVPPLDRDRVLSGDIGVLADAVAKRRFGPPIIDRSSYAQ
jgi:histidine ammonia-lyase